MDGATRPGNATAEFQSPFASIVTKRADILPHDAPRVYAPGPVRTERVEVRHRTMAPGQGSDDRPQCLYVRSPAVLDLYRDRSFRQFEQSELPRCLRQYRRAAEGRQVQVRELGDHPQGADLPVLFPDFPAPFTSLAHLHSPGELAGNLNFPMHPLMALASQAFRLFLIRGCWFASWERSIQYSYPAPKSIQSSLISNPNSDLLY